MPPYLTSHQHHNTSHQINENRSTKTPLLWKQQPKRKREWRMAGQQQAGPRSRHCSLSTTMTMKIWSIGTSHFWSFLLVMYLLSVLDTPVKNIASWTKKWHFDSTCPLGLGVWFVFRVDEVPGSIPGVDPFLSLLSSASILQVLLLLHWMINWRW